MKIESKGRCNSMRLPHRALVVSLSVATAGIPLQYPLLHSPPSRYRADLHENAPDNCLRDLWLPIKGISTTPLSRALREAGGIGGRRG